VLEPIAEKPYSPRYNDPSWRQEIFTGPPKRYVVDIFGIRSIFDIITGFLIDNNITVDNGEDAPGETACE
jgi:hypothetical protein